MKINIILPFFLKKPGGGFKIMYEYANRLACIGFDVRIYHCCKVPFTINENVSDRIIHFKYLLNYIINNNKKRPKWISLDRSIVCTKIPFISDAYIRDADYIITTWWATALECKKLSLKKGKRINLIQGYEKWMGHENLLHESYLVKDQINVAISKYVYDKVSTVSSNRLELIPNSFNMHEFFIKKIIKDRNPRSVSLMYSKQELKGSVYALEALVLLKLKYPDLVVNVFSVYSQPKNMPRWINFYKNPHNLCSIYNNSAIFLSTSIEEGWGLTPMESIASGCACIATDIPGHREFLENENNALLIPPRNVDRIIQKISFLIDNNEYRINLAERGHRSIVGKYTWDISVGKLVNILNE